MQIWLSGNLDAHHFISKDYWYSNFSMVREQILQAEVFVYETDEEIQGFIGIIDEYIAGIFVDKKYRSHGIGKKLLEFVKKIHGTLSLAVYQKNDRAVKFYLREGFEVLSKQIDENTGEMECIMTWKKQQKSNSI